MQKPGSHRDVVSFCEEMWSDPKPLKEQCWEVIPDKLFFTIHRDQAHTIECIKANPHNFYFSSWMQDSYCSFCSDFGPVDLSAVVSFCHYLREKMLHPRLADRPLVYYCDPDTAYTTNTAFLLGAYLLLVEKWTPERAARTFDKLPPHLFRMYRDATHTPSTFDLCLLDCLRGLQRAVDAGWLDLEKFDLQAFEMLADSHTGDLSVVCPKFLAFRGPRATPRRGGWERRPQDFVELFKVLNVSSVVRLNEPGTYDPRAWTEHGINHHDLYFDDCTAPSEQLVDDFHEICHRDQGLVAVHCMAGLGRTGTLIATWIMKEHGWSAREAMAWVRIVRPGSVIGPQQHFLEAYEQRLRGESGEVVAEGNVLWCSEAHSQLLSSQIAAACLARAEAADESVNESG